MTCPLPATCLGEGPSAHHVTPTHPRLPAFLPPPQSVQPTLYTSLSPLCLPLRGSISMPGKSLTCKLQLGKPLCWAGPVNLGLPCQALPQDPATACSWSPAPAPCSDREALSPKPRSLAQLPHHRSLSVLEPHMGLSDMHPFMSELSTLWPTVGGLLVHSCVMFHSVCVCVFV